VYIYSKSGKRFSPDMEGIGPSIMSLHALGTWVSTRTFMYSERGFPHVRVVYLCTCVWIVCIHVLEHGFLCVRNVGFDIFGTPSDISGSQFFHSLLWIATWWITWPDLLD